MIPAQNIRVLSKVRRSVLVFRMIFMSSLVIQGQTFDVGLFQRDFVSQFTGLTPLSNSGQLLSGRSKASRRQQSENYLCSKLKELGLSSNRHDYSTSNSFFLLDFFFAPVSGTNVYSIIPATEPTDEYVVVGAHYDAEPGSPGAGDNASGVALVLAVGKKLSELKVRKKKVMIVFFDQEEDDELGSKAFAKKLKDCNANVHSAHITDVIGWDDNHDFSVELQSPTERLERQYRSAADAAGIPVRITKGGSSDNKSFNEAGFETVGVFSDDMTPHIHKPSDNFETVNFDYLLSSTSLVFQVIKNIIQQ